MKRTRIHVVYDRADKHWETKREGSPVPLSSHDTKDEAVDAGRGLAQAAEGQVIIHLKRGPIQEERTFGPDPFPPKG